MLEDYIKFKKVYPKSVIMIKSGSFYECLNDDATIMNSIFEYKIIRLKKYTRVGFPISKINYITGILTNKEINYSNVTKISLVENLIWKINRRL